MTKISTLTDRKMIASTTFYRNLKNNMKYDKEIYAYKFSNLDEMDAYFEGHI